MPKGFGKPKPPKGLYLVYRVHEGTVYVERLVASKKEAQRWADEGTEPGTYMVRKVEE